MLTEAEAKTRWCPFGRIVAHVRPNDAATGEPLRTAIAAAAINTWQPDAEGQTGTNCRGSQCMMWIWMPPPDEEQGYCGLSRSRNG